MYNIGWLALKKSLKAKQGLYQVTIFKKIHFWPPTSRYAQTNDVKRLVSSLCKGCNQIDDQLHYLKCHSEYFTEARQHVWVEFGRGVKRYRSEKRCCELFGLVSKTGYTRISINL